MVVRIHVMIVHHQCDVKTSYPLYLDAFPFPAGFQTDEEDFFLGFERLDRLFPLSGTKGPVQIRITDGFFRPGAAAAGAGRSGRHLLW
jgi:hypothetical protein